MRITPLTQDEIKSLMHTPMFAFIVEDTYRVKMARRLFVKYIDYKIPNRVLKYLRSEEAEQQYVYIFTPQNKKLYVTLLERNNRLEVINLLNLSSFPNDVELIKYPIVSFDRKSFTNEKQIVDYVMNTLNLFDSYQDKKELVYNTKNNESEVCKTIANTKKSGLSEILNSVDKKLMGISNIGELLDTAKLNKEKAQLIIKCHYGKDKRKVLFERGMCYDDYFLGKRITHNSKGNYYINNGKDVIIIVPQSIIDKIQNTNEYELVGSGQDPRFPQTFGRNTNEKVRSQSLLGTRILVFYSDNKNHLYFYDEVKYVDHRIITSENYQNDVILFKFKSIIS